MLSTLRNQSMRGGRLKGLLVAVLLMGSGAALGAEVPVTLCATSGTATLPDGANVPVWGYTDCSASASLTAPGGPAIDATVGDTINVTLTNDLPEDTGLLFQGQGMVPDRTGVASGAAGSYSFTATQPGTYLYEAALLPNDEHQVAMGLYGALVVRPATPGQAYDDASTAFDDEAMLILSEIDPALNNSADPAAFDMRNFAPRYFLINGKAYPDTATIPSAAGDKLLLRYVNAGAKHHSMGVLGLRQRFVAKDASLLATGDVELVTETLAPGQTADAIAAIPASATTESRFAVYDGSLMLHNNGAAGFGGMLTFVTAGAGTAAAGPVTSNVALTPNPTNGTVAVGLSASVSSSSSTVDSVEYFIDATAAGGTGTAMAGTTTASASISVSTLGALTSGNHTFYVHGHDTAGNWGAFSSAVLNLDKTGPTTGPLTLTPNPSNGSVAVALSATANDSATGNSNVTAAQYTIDGGTAVAMTLGGAPAPIRSLTATLPTGLAAGSHPVTVRSQDAFGNWGPVSSAQLNVVAGGPSTTVNSVVPSPNNGTVPLDSTHPVVRATATMASTGSTIAAAEGFIDTVGASGTGFPFVPSDGQWNSPTETGYADIPLATIASLSGGNHTIYVRGKDAAGNWGSTSTKPLVIDKTAPAIGSATITPSTIVFGTAGVTLSVTATDVGTGVAGGQYWIDGSATPPGTATAFTGSSATISTGTLPGGVHTVYVRVRDSAQNWSAVSSVTLYVVQAVNDAPAAISANGSATQTSDVNAANGVLANDQPTGMAGRTATITSAPARTSGNGSGTITVTCPVSLGIPATPAISGNTICTNGAYRVTLNGVGNGGNARRSKRGTFQFTYTETLNGASSAATVTITVN